MSSKKSEHSRIHSSRLAAIRLALALTITVAVAFALISAVVAGALASAVLDFFIRHFGSFLII